MLNLDLDGLVCVYSLITLHLGLTIKVGFNGAVLLARWKLTGASMTLHRIESNGSRVRVCAVPQACITSQSAMRQFLCNWGDKYYGVEGANYSIGQDDKGALVLRQFVFNGAQRSYGEQLTIS